MNDQLNKIEKQLRTQRLYSIALTVCLAAIVLSSFKNNANTDVIRTKGIIIVDSSGKERILIGSPIHYAHNRVRDDIKKVQAAWGKRFAPQYLDWYKKYYNSANGIVFLDDKGFDRLAIGENVPDPNIGKRVGPATGMIINDAQGFERSGYSLLTVEGQDRMVLGLDRKGGMEGVTLSIMEDESAGLAVLHKKNWLYLGNAAKDGLPVNLDKDLFGLKISDTSGIKYDLNVIK